MTPVPAGHAAHEALPGVPPAGQQQFPGLVVVGALSAQPTPLPEKAADDVPIPGQLTLADAPQPAIWEAEPVPRQLALLPEPAPWEADAPPPPEPPRPRRPRRRRPLASPDQLPLFS